METYGVTHFDFGSLGDLKRSILYFDRLLFDYRLFEDYIAATELKFLGGLQPANISEAIAVVEYLMDREVFVDYDFRTLLSLVESTEEIEFTEAKSGFFSRLEAVNSIVERYNGIVTGEAPGFEPGLDIDYALALWGGAESAARELSRYQSMVTPLVLGRDDQSRHIIPVLSGALSDKPIGRKEAVIHVVMQKFPTPGDDIALEQLLEFKQDPSSRAKFLALRNWISEVARTDLPIHEIEEKMEFLQSEYEEHLRLHRLSYHQSTLEVFVTTTLEVLENVVKLNWSKAAKILFQLRKQEITLTIEERKAPGRELAYLQSANRAFGH